MVDVAAVAGGAGLHRLSHSSPTLPAFVRLLALYESRGYSVHTGLNPAWFANPDVSLTSFSTPHGGRVDSGWGIAPIEATLFDWLAAAGMQPGRVFVLGNGFGWSTLLFAMLWPDARIVAFDACIEGAAARAALDLTAAIAGEQGWDVRIAVGVSPRDVAATVDAELDGAVDFAFIDGLHTDVQQQRDFDALAPFLTTDAIVACHDVIAWRTLASYEAIAEQHGLEPWLLTRTPSGMGVLLPAQAPEPLRVVLRALVDHDPAVQPVLTAAREADGVAVSVPDFRRSPGLAWRPVLQARCHLMLGECEEARRCFEQASEDPATAFDAWLGLARLAADRGDHLEALVCADRAMRLRPEAVAPHHRRGLTLRALGDVAQARAAFARARELAPNWFAPHHDLGLVARESGNFAEAAESFRAAIACDPAWTDGHLELGITHVLAGEPEAAMVALDAVLALDSTRAIAHHERGRALRALGHLEEADAALARASGLEPMWAPPRHERGVLARDQGRMADAHEHFLSAAVVDATWPWSRFDLGLACADAGDDASAARWFGEAADLAPTWVDAREQHTNALRRVREREFEAVLRPVLVPAAAAGRRIVLYGVFGPISDLARVAISRLPGVGLAGAIDRAAAGASLDDLIVSRPDDLDAFAPAVILVGGSVSGPSIRAMLEAHADRFEILPLYDLNDPAWTRAAMEGRPMSLDAPLSRTDLTS
jgi:tetratricopeptide (TPR) repeat protein/predicted O-methyltransferase YrrM